MWEYLTTRRLTAEQEIFIFSPIENESETPQLFFLSFFLDLSVFQCCSSCGNWKNLQSLNKRLSVHRISFKIFKKSICIRCEGPKKTWSKVRIVQECGRRSVRIITVYGDWKSIKNVRSSQNHLSRASRRGRRSEKSVQGSVESSRMYQLSMQFKLSSIDQKSSLDIQFHN